MSQTHLSDARLQALHDGESGDCRELEHLASCPVCQQAFDDTRWRLLLIQLRREAEVDAGPHPDRDELLAFQTGAMSGSQQAEIRRHLSGCRTCMMTYGRSREARRRAAYSTPSRKTLYKTMQQFRPRKMRKLGRLLVERIGKRLALDFLADAEPILRQMRIGLVSEESAMLGDAERGRHPSSASRRAKRLRDAAEETLNQELGEPERNAAVVAPMASGRFASIGGFTEPRADTATIAEAPWSLRVNAIPGQREDRLQVALDSTGNGHSASKVTIRIVPERGEETSALTDDRGAASLPCPPGLSLLIVEVDPPLVVEVQFDD